MGDAWYCGTLPEENRYGGDFDAVWDQRLDEWKASLEELLTRG